MALVLVRSDSDKGVRGQWDSLQRTMDHTTPTNDETHPQQLIVPNPNKHSLQSGSKTPPTLHHFIQIPKKKHKKKESSSASSASSRKRKTKEGGSGGGSTTKKLRKPTAQEDIVDGFAFLAFKNYAELSRAVELGKEDSVGGGGSKLCVQVLKGSQHNQSTPTSKHAATNTQQNKPHKRKLKKYMDQENGDVTGGGERSTPPPPFSRVVPPSTSPKPPATKKSRLSKHFKNHFSEEGEQATQPNNKSINTSKISETCSHLPIINPKGNGEMESPPLPPIPPPPPPPTLDRIESLIVPAGSSSSAVNSGSSSCGSSSPPPPPTHSSPSLPIGGTSSSSYIPSQTPPDTLTTTTLAPPTKEEFGGSSSSSTTNGGVPPLNGHTEKPKSTSLFTPYATNTITRVSLGSGERSRVESPPPTTFPPHHHHQYYSQQQGTGESLAKKSSTSSVVFGSIARLLDTPTSSSGGNGRSHHDSPSPGGCGPPPSPHISSAPTPPSAVSSTTLRSSPAIIGGGTLPPGISSSLSRSHSPRGHSPCRERDSYSSSVSSLSRTSVTPVSCSSSGAIGASGGSLHNLPPNLSPQLSYSKAASWLSSVPVPRPSPPPPPPPHSLASAMGVASSMFAPMPPGGPPGGLPGGPPGVLAGGPPPPHSYVGRTTPAESIHSALLHASSSSSDFVRRDFESRFMGGMMRGNEIHSLLPPAQNPSIYPPSSSAIFKEMSKRDSPFYRSGYPGGGGGMLPPTPFAPPPSQLPTFTQKKSGRWNAMHVRIAWEIYQHQQKSGGGGEVKGCLQGPSLKSNGGSGGSSSSGGANHLQPPSLPPSSSSDLFRPPSHSFSREMSAYNVSPLLSPQVPGQRGPTFEPHHPMYLAQSHLGGGMGRYPGFGGLGSPFVGGLSSLGSSLLARDLSALQQPPSVQEQWARLSRSGGWGGGGGVPPPPHELPSSSPLRERSPIRRENGDLETSGESSSNYGRTNSVVDVPKGPSNRGMYGGGMISGGGGVNWGQPFPRFSAPDSFRLLEERERELSRLPPGGGGGRVGGSMSSPYAIPHRPPRHPSQEEGGRKSPNEFPTLAPL